jgi:hypothetical protein
LKTTPSAAARCLQNKVVPGKHVAAIDRGKFKDLSCLTSNILMSLLPWLPAL